MNAVTTNLERPQECGHDEPGSDRVNAVTTNLGATA
jgi:hypothetical protein